MATQRQKTRKTGSLARLEAQLASGKKPLRIENEKRKKGYSTSPTETVPLTDADKKRLTDTIGNLKKALGLQVAA